MSPGGEEQLHVWRMGAVRSPWRLERRLPRLLQLHRLRCRRHCCRGGVHRPGRPCSTCRCSTFAPCQDAVHHITFVHASIMGARAVRPLPCDRSPATMEQSDVGMSHVSTGQEPGQRHSHRHDRVADRHHRPVPAGSVRLLCSSPLQCCVSKRLGSGTLGHKTAVKRHAVHPAGLRCCLLRFSLCALCGLISP